MYQRINFSEDTMASSSNSYYDDKEYSENRIKKTQDEVEEVSKYLKLIKYLFHIQLYLIVTVYFFLFTLLYLWSVLIRYRSVSIPLVSLSFLN